jgi:hypothetical protein
MVKAPEVGCMTFAILQLQPEEHLYVLWTARVFPPVV